MAKSYWREREEKHIKERIKNDKRIARRLRRNYKESLDDIQEQIDAFYGRYADKEGVSIEEVKKRISKTDMQKYERKAKKYVKERNFSPTANEEMRMYNLTMRVNRLELLKKNLELELLALSSEEEALLYKELMKSAIQEYEHLSGILGETLEANAKKLESIVNASFLSATWSDRIWSNQRALRAELDKLLNRAIVQGLNPREVARELRKTIETSVYNAERLMRTEMARLQADIFEDSMDQAGVEKYEFIAEDDACPICAELDGQVFDKKDAKVGVNMYPVHPNCRCSTSMYVDRDEWEVEMKRRGL